MNLYAAILFVLLPATLAAADVRLTHQVLEFNGRRWMLIVSTRTNGENVVYQQLVPLDGTTGEIPSPQFHPAPAVRSPRSGLTPLLADIDSRMPAGHIYTADDPWTWAHETTHGVNNRLRNARGGRVNAFYFPGGQAAYTDEPRTTIASVAPLVPSSLRGPRYQLYLISQQRDWNDRSLYLLDEWVSYINGAEVFLETPESIRANWIVTPGAVEFAIYGTCVAMASRSDDEQLRRVLAHMWRASLDIHDRYSRPESHETLSRFQTSADASRLREFCAGYFGKAWVDRHLMQPLPAVDRVEPGREWFPPPFMPPERAVPARDPRVIVFLNAPSGKEIATQSDAVRSDVLPWLSDAGWTIGEGADNHLQLVEVDWQVCQQWNVRHLPTFIRVKGGREQRRYVGHQRSGVVDVLRETERQVIADQRYPVRGGWWSFPVVSKADLVRHLQTGEHAGLFDLGWLNSLTYSELMSLHSDEHQKQVQWQYVPRRAVRQRTAYRPVAACPGGT